MFFTMDQIRGFSGYAKAVRELGYHMAKEYPVSMVDFQQVGYLPEKIYPLLSGDTPKLRKQDVVFGRPYFDNPFKLEGAGHYIANFVLEGTRFPEKAVVQLNNNKFEQIWVPSKHCYDNLVANNVVEDKIRIIPHGFDPKVYKVKKVDPKPYFKFLFVGGYTGPNDRKGADLLVKAFTEEFKEELKSGQGRDDVEGLPMLYLKINTSYGDASTQLERFGVVVDTNFYSEQELANLYNTADCYVCPSQGEGFDMTTLEAMACGLPVIHNSWGGQNDYMMDMYDWDRTIFLHSSTIPAKFSPWDIGNWMKPDLKSLKHSLRLMYEEQPTKGKYKNINNWTWDKAAEKAIKAVDELCND